MPCAATANRSQDGVGDKAAWLFERARGKEREKETERARETATEREGEKQSERDRQSERRGK